MLTTNFHLLYNVFQNVYIVVICKNAASEYRTSRLTPKKTDQHYIRDFAFLSEKNTYLNYHPELLEVVTLGVTTRRVS